MRLRKLGEVARSDPWERGSHGVNRHGEPVVSQVSPPVRVLSGLLALVLGWAASLGVGEPGGLLVGFAALAAVFAAIALVGVHELVVDPPASERFHELADPARPLDEPPDDQTRANTE